MYFIMLFIITMKRQLKHMIKHKYVPWTAGKKKFQGKDDKGEVSYYFYEVPLWRPILANACPNSTGEDDPS